MGTKGTAETERTDLGTLLGALVGQVRSDGLAVLGFAAANHQPGCYEYEALQALAGSLDRTAGLLDTARAQLCQDCQMVEVSERWTFGAKASHTPKRQRA